MHWGKADGAGLTYSCSETLSMYTMGEVRRAVGNAESAARELGVR